jgi:5-enolpyruvylshikimate-3-phosphate synthase
MERASKQKTAAEFVSQQLMFAIVKATLKLLTIDSLQRQTVWHTLRALRRHGKEIEKCEGPTEN